MSRSNRRRTGSRTITRAVWERLEGRLLLCATVEELISAGIPASVIMSDGHIAYKDYVNLTAEQQSHVDPHFIQDARGADGPVDFDAILGIPTSVSGDGPDGANDTFPDWFPSLNGGGITLDQTSQPGRVLVKFPSGIHNQGTGPGMAISGRPGVDPIPTGAPITNWLNPDGSHAVLQPIYSFSGGTFTLSHYRNAGSFTYHSGHAHFHFDGYGIYRLRQSVGGVPGDYVQRPDGTAIIGEKIGFCLINTGSSFTMENGQSSTTLPGYNAPGQPSPGCGLIQGVHVGKTDGYGSGTSGQWLDVTGVPNGQYFLEITLDGENVMQETNEANNSKTFPFTLNVNPPPGGITPDEYDAVGNNNTFGNAADMAVMGTYNKTGLTVHWGQDWDYFRFEASSTGTYNVTMTAANGNLDLYLFDKKQTQIAASTQPSGTETITYNFVEGETYYAMVRSYNSTTSSNYQIAWNLKPLASSSSSVGVAIEGSTVGKFRIERNGPIESPLTVNFSLGGTAVNGVDYELVATTVAISNLFDHVEIEIVPIDDNIVEDRRTVILTILSNSAYVVGPTGTTVIIADNDVDPGPILPGLAGRNMSMLAPRVFGDQEIDDRGDENTDLLV